MRDQPWDTLVWCLLAPTAGGGSPSRWVCSTTGSPRWLNEPGGLDCEDASTKARPRFRKVPLSHAITGAPSLVGLQPIAHMAGVYVQHRTRCRYFSRSVQGVTNRREGACAPALFGRNLCAACALMNAARTRNPPTAGGRKVDLLQLPLHRSSEGAGAGFTLSSEDPNPW